MPRRLLGVLILLLVSVAIGRAQGDAVLFTVGADTVRQHEFEYHWKRSTEDSRDAFLQKYGRFKQKVQYAKDLGLDTLPEHRLRKEQFQQLFDRKGKGIRRSVASAQEWIKLVHVTCLLDQQADKQQILQSKAYLDSLYAVIQQGGKIPVKELSWMQTRHLLNEWQKQLEGLGKNEYSQPFYSPMGVHLIAWTDRRMGSSGNVFSLETNEAFRGKEVEEGLLVTSLDAYVEQNLNCTEQELEKYFKQRRSDYGWGTPHFRGAVIHCQDKKTAKKIKKYLQKYPERHWPKAWNSMPEEITKEARLETGLFPIGKNPFVDKLVFKCGTFDPLTDYPYSWVLGKKLKKGPTHWEDVREKVYQDCKKDKNEAEMEAIIRKYELEIDEEVLKTVNHERIK